MVIELGKTSYKSRDLMPKLSNLKKTDGKMFQAGKEFIEFVEIAA